MKKGRWNENREMEEPLEISKNPDAIYHRRFEEDSNSILHSYNPLILSIKNWNGYRIRLKSICNYLIFILYRLENWPKEYNLFFKGDLWPNSEI